MSEAPIITEVRTSEDDVNAVKNEMTTQAAGGAMPGTPIDRIPYSPQLALLEASGVYTKKIAATDRCIRTIEVPQRGGTTLKYHCSRPCVGVGNQQLCPDHNKDFFQPNQTGTGPKPRSFNSASIPLTKAETEIRNEKGEVIGHLKEGRTIIPPGSAPVAPQVTTEAVLPVKLVPAPNMDGAQIAVTFTLDELASGNALAAFVQRTTEALDGLPCNSVRQMKQIVAIQEKIAKLAKRGKHDSATSSL